MVALLALFLAAGFSLCVYVYTYMCVGNGTRKPALLSHRRHGLAAGRACAPSLAAQPVQGCECSFGLALPVGMNECIQAALHYFIAACFRAGLGSRVSARGFPWFWTVVLMGAVQASSW